MQNRTNSGPAIFRRYGSGASLYDEAKKKGWTVISMKNDWKSIFSFDK